MSKVRKVVNLMIGLLIIGSISYCSYSFGSAESRMRQTCGEITFGMSVAALSAFAKEHGLNLPRQESGEIFMVESKTFGRWGCRVVLEKRGGAKCRVQLCRLKWLTSRLEWTLQRTILAPTLWLIDKDMTSGIFEKLDSFWIENDYLQFHIHTIQLEKVMN